MRNYVNTDDELKLLYELTGLAHLLSAKLIQALLGCSRRRLPGPWAYDCWPSGRGLLWMGSTFPSLCNVLRVQVMKYVGRRYSKSRKRNATVIDLSGHFHASGI